MRFLAMEISTVRAPSQRTMTLEHSRSHWRLLMRVCLASLHPRVLSGQIDSMAGLGRALDHRGHQVTFVAPFDTSGLLFESLTALDTGPRPLASAARAMLEAVPRIMAASRKSDLLHL